MSENAVPILSAIVFRTLFHGSFFLWENNGIRYAANRLCAPDCCVEEPFRILRDERVVLEGSISKAVVGETATPYFMCGPGDNRSELLATDFQDDDLLLIYPIADRCPEPNMHRIYWSHMANMNYDERDRLYKQRAA